MRLEPHIKQDPSNFTFNNDITTAQYTAIDTITGCTSVPNELPTAAMASLFHAQSMLDQPSYSFAQPTSNSEPRQHAFYPYVVSTPLLPCPTNS